MRLTTVEMKVGLSDRVWNSARELCVKRWNWLRSAKQASTTNGVEAVCEAVSLGGWGSP